MYPNIKIATFKGQFSRETIEKIQKFLSKSKDLKDNKIISLNEDFDQKIILIFLANLESKKINHELDFEKLGAKFYDFMKREEIIEIFIQSPNIERTKNINYLISISSWSRT